MSKQLALVLSGVFCLIFASTAEDVCQLDAAMTIFNMKDDYIKTTNNFLFRGSKMYQVYRNEDGTLSKGPVYDIISFWKGWSGKKVTRAMFLYEKDNSAAIIGDSVSTHLVRFNENLEVIAGSYRTWPENFLQLFPGESVFLSNYQPGYVCMYYNASKKTECHLLSIDLMSRRSRLRNEKERHEYNPDLIGWTTNFYSENLKLIGIIKTRSDYYCKNRLKTSCRLKIMAWDYEEYFVAFIENNSQTLHCFGKFSDRNREDCTKSSQYEATSTSLFGCDEKEVDSQSTTSPSTTLQSTTSILTVETSPSKLTATAETTTGFDDKQDKIEWIIKALIGSLIIVILGISCYGYSVKKKKDPHQYKLLKDKKEKKKKKKFKLRRAKDLKLFGSSESESEKTV